MPCADPPPPDAEGGPNPEPPAFVYVIGTFTPAGPRTYVGWSFDVTRRLAEHNGQGGRGAKSTRGRVWQLLHVEAFTSKRAAMQREWALKRDRKLRKALAVRYISPVSLLPASE